MLTTMKTIRPLALLAILSLLLVSTAAAEMPPLELKAKVPGGMLATSQGKRFLILAGTPKEMGTAHGQLLKEDAKALFERVLYAVGGAESVHSGRWFLDTSAEIMDRAGKHVPERFWEECDAMADAMGVSRRDARYGNLFPERFHCTGIAVRGKASKGGHVVHARVLDYMRDIGLQRQATIMVFKPKGYNAWISQSYAGFIGTVTSMNEKHLSMGEMGGGGEGNWDGCPMSFMMRDVMERASNVEEAIKIIKETPLTCQYFYILSDASGNMAGLACEPGKVTVVRAGEQLDKFIPSEMKKQMKPGDKIPRIPEDTIVISGLDRGTKAIERINKVYGEIDAQAMIEIIKRPVAMRSNLHDAVFLPESLDMWFADAGEKTNACDEPYAKCNLKDLLDFYEANKD